MIRANAAATTDREPERLTTAAQHFNTAFLERFATVRDVRPETVVACTARMAGTMLFRSSENEQASQLMEIMFITLREAGHALTEQELDNADATTEASQLSLKESRTLLDATVLSYCQSAGLTFEEAAHALAIATALFIHDCRAMLDVRKGAAIAVYGFVEGCKTAPPAVAAVRTQAPPAAWELAPVGEASPYATPAAPVGPPASEAGPSLTKYILLFAGGYAALMMLAGWVTATYGIRSGGINSGVFIAMSFLAGAKFVKDHRRLWRPREKWRLMLGILLVTIAFDLVVVWLLMSDKVPFAIMAAGTAFLGVLRLLGLWVFFSLLGRRIFGRYAVSG